jgi:hypothetical protein
LGQTEQSSPKEIKTREMKEKIKANTGRSTKKKDDPQPMRPPELSHHASSNPDHRGSSNTFNKESDDDAAASRTSPRVSPSTLRWVGKGYPDVLHEGMTAPTGVTASVPDEPTRFLPTPKHSTKLAADQHAPPRFLTPPLLSHYGHCREA